MTQGETAEKVIAILQHTQDGDKLSKAALKLTESAVNNHLNKYGLKLLDRLYEMVMGNTYSAAKFKQAIKDMLPTNSRDHQLKPGGMHKDTGSVGKA